MTDESAPNEPRQTTEADQSATSVQVRTSETGGSTAPSTASSPAPSGGGTSPEPAKRTPAPASKEPLITAVEIENFKGIGRAVRIDLRPITLLFGRNSAGKSTVLHALCYAHEILNHRNVDPHKVEIAGDQVDLGGFQNLVHGHDLERVVRFRFELNLENWFVPDRLLEKMARPEISESVDPDIAAAFEDWVLVHARGELARTGWVEVQVGTRGGVRPTVVLYEVGVNEALVGRIVPGRRGDELEYNWAHPWFAELHGEGSVQPPTSAREAPSDVLPKSSEELHRAEVIWGSASGLPSWNENLDVDNDSLAVEGIVDPKAYANESYARFRALIGGAVVGIGRTLCAHTATIRYLGPLRRLRPAADAEHGSRDPGQWSDGSAAWNVLAPDASDSRPDGNGLIDEVNEWLARHDRLDTGYRLDQQSTLALAGDVPFVKEIRSVEGAFGTYRIDTGIVDVERWIHDRARQIASLGENDAADLQDNSSRPARTSRVPPSRVPSVGRARSNRA